ncbi:MAG: UDP-glucose 4-epimerase family protein [Burkholderiaceae bacterium]
MSTRILVTGATGFIGRALLARFAADGQSVRAAVRTAAPDLEVEQVRVGDLGPETAWDTALAGCDAVVHAAARVHVMRERAAEPLAEYHRANVEGTVHLARCAAAAGVRRFVFISSIKVNGEETQPGRPFRVDDPPLPVDAYGASKLHAEEGLRRVAAETGMQLVIVRPPLVYGPGVKANFLALMRALHRGVPMPLGAIHNKRTLVALDNLVDLIAACVSHPAAANALFLAGDAEDLSTTELARRLAAALGVRPRLLPVPARLFEAGARIIGAGALAHRLCRCLQIDTSAARERLGWSPPVSVDEALRRTATHFLRTSAT